MSASSASPSTSRSCEEKYLRFLTDAGTSFRAASGGTLVNGYTSDGQVTWIARALDLSPDDLLLDLGAGRGWPGGLIAERTGARLVSIDLPIEALRQGRGVLLERCSGGVHHVCGDGRRLPIGDGHFSAVCHTDVLC